MRLYSIMLLAFLSATTVCAQTAVYQPLGTWVDPDIAAFNQWERSRQALTSPTRSLAATTRPQVAGLRPLEVELLEDAMLRKRPNAIPTQQRARQHIIRMSKNPTGRNYLNGAMNEALFVERNPEWGYVRSPNAPQHDVYRWVPGRSTPETGQLKFHADGNPAKYAADIRRDFRAQRIFIPDNHVDAAKAYLKADAERLSAAGDNVNAKARWRDYARVRGTGATSEEVIEARRSAEKFEIRQRYATYVAFGATLALAVGPTIWNWANGNLPANQAIYRTTRALSVLGVGVGTDLALMTIKQGALRGTVRGNAIVGTAVVITETAWLLYEHGWSQAFSKPEFYESFAGSVTGIAFGLAASGATVAWVPGPGWVVGGAAIVTGAVAGTVGYIGGRSATHMVFEILAPEKLQQCQRERIAEVNEMLAGRTSQLQLLTR